MASIYKDVNVYSFKKLKSFLYGGSRRYIDALQWASTIQGDEWGGIFQGKEIVCPRQRQWLEGLIRAKGGLQNEAV